MANMVYCYFPDQNDIDSACLCTWKEARGDGEVGMQAVMEVIINRSLDWDHTWHDVVYAKNQFSSMSIPSDKQFNLQPAAGDAQYTFCLQLSQQKLALLKPGLIDEAPIRAASSVSNAHYYLEPEEATSGWFFNNIVNKPAQHPFVKKVGHQLFYV